MSLFKRSPQRVSLVSRQSGPTRLRHISGFSVARGAACAAALALACFGIVRADHFNGDPHQGERYASMSKDSSYGGVVASISEQASAVGIDILNQGGNAMDAAIATVFAIGVARPDMGGIGGGGFLLYRSKDNEVAALDFRETAPSLVADTTFQGAGMHKDGLPPHGTFFGEMGSGHLPVGVPGTVAGMEAALDRYGSGEFTLAELIAPAWRLAKDGVGVTYELGFFAFFNHDRLSYYPETAKIYGDLEALWAAGQQTSGPPLPLLKQEDYARSLALIATYGTDAFYKTAPPESLEVPCPIDPTEPVELLPTTTCYPAFTFPEINGHYYPAGPSIAHLIIKDMAQRPKGNEYWDPTSPATFNPTLIARFDTTGNDKGLMTGDDLANYRPIWREPLRTTFAGHRVYAMPPPASGMTVIETLNLLNGFPLGSNTFPPADSLESSWAQSSANHLHVLAETQKIAFADRAKFLADPDSVQVPVKLLTDEDYADLRRVEIDLDSAKTYQAAEVATGSHTNHLSVIDKDGNAVAVTTTNNSTFGSVVVPKGAGFLLNDELRDFNMDSAGTANEALGGKRPRSSTSPAIVMKGGARGKPVLVVGGAGGSTIIMGVVQSIVNVAVFGRPLYHAIDDERVDTLAWPGSGKLGLENRVLQAVETELQRRWHTTERQSNNYNGNPLINAAGVDLATGWKRSVADPRHVRNGFDAITSPPGRDEERGAAGQ